MTPEQVQLIEQEQGYFDPADYAPTPIQVYAILGICGELRMTRDDLVWHTFREPHHKYRNCCEGDAEKVIERGLEIVKAINGE